jgi:Cysteine-rich secretory protein family
MLFHDHHMLGAHDSAMRLLRQAPASVRLVVLVFACVLPGHASMPRRQGQMAGPSGVCPDSVESVLISLVNEERVQRGLAPLRVDVRLMQSARRHSSDMAKQGYVGHDDDGSTAGRRASRAGFQWRFLAEDLGTGLSVRSPPRGCPFRAGRVRFPQGGPARCAGSHGAVRGSLQEVAASAGGTCHYGRVARGFASLHGVAGG